ncbi:neuropeptide FF receptor 2-like [Stylophora pistillata]|uniref:neuropeptide FF receptor 2-like n=1 Tax=Stylophora pistillata TaxID=50429 RepID=UPI000C04D456|nr:neuropeptide FF receptor 2-like [Stylophora pistillata]
MESEGSQDYSLSCRVTFSIMTGVVFLVSFFGNSSVIHIVRRSQKMRSTTFLLILNMACADLVISTWTSALLIKYLLLCYHLWKRQVPGEFNALQQQIANRMARRVTLMMITVIVIFFICWAPQFVFSWLHPFAEQLAMEAPIWLIPFTIWLKILNSAANPIIYAIFNESFRKGFRHILYCDKFFELNTAEIRPQPCANTHTNREPAQDVQLLNFHSILHCEIYDK